MGRAYEQRFPISHEMIAEVGVPFNGKVSLKMAEILAPFITDLARVARRGALVALHFRVHYSVQIPTGAVTRENTRLQRGCIHTVTVNVPGLENQPWEGPISLSELDHASSLANLPAVMTRAWLPSEHGDVPATLVDASGNVTSVSQPDSTIMAANGWPVLSGRATAAQSSGAPKVQVIDDVYTFAPCLMSSRPALDTIPLGAFANPNSQVQFTVGAGNPATSGLFDAGTTNVSENVTVQLWMSFVPKRATKDDIAQGLPWAYRNVPRQGPVLVMDPKRKYRFVGIMPLFNSEVLDGALRAYYEPLDWPGFAENKIKWQERNGNSWTDVFPLMISAGEGPVRRHVLELYTFIARRGGNLGTPRDSQMPDVLFPSAEKGHTRISDRLGTADTYGAFGLGASGFSSVIGYTSFVPLFPLAVSSFADQGFPGFPATADSDCAPQIQLVPDDRPAASQQIVTELWANPWARDTYVKLDGIGSPCGCADTGSKPVFIPAVEDPKSVTASKVLTMVPWVAQVDTGTAVNVLVPNSTKEALAKGQK